MTIATTDAQSHDDLTRVARELGVFVYNDAGEIVGIDDLSGLQRDLVQTISDNDVPPLPSIRRRVHSAIRAVRAWARAAVRAAREAFAWLAQPVAELCARHRINRQGVFYRPRHGVQRAWYGVQRPSASTAAIQRRNATRESDSESALPEHFVSYLAVVIEAMRGHEDALHPRAGFQYRC